MDGVCIEVRVNEQAMRAANPHVPWSPEEIAADAAACAAAGASIVHFHGRHPTTGAPATDAATYAETIRRVRDACDVVVMPTIGAGTIEDPAQRVVTLRHLAADPATRPELAPVDLATVNLDPWDPVAKCFRAEDLVYLNPVRTLRYLTATIRDLGVAPCAVLWGVGSARMLGALIEMGALAQPVYTQLTLSGSLLSTHPPTAAGLRALVDFLPPDLRGAWAVLAVGADLLPLLGPAVAAGGHVALGLGDHPYLELGTPTNAEVVAEVVRRLAAMGRRPATPAEVRAELALT